VIRTSLLPGPPLDPAGYDLLCLTSPVGVAAMFQRLRAGGRDARALAGARLAVIGPGTAEALAEHGIIADIVPQRAVAEGLLETLSEISPPVRRALLARAREGREELPDGLRARGAEVDVLALYETVAQPLSAGELAAVREADYITFTSSSTVRFFLEAADDRAAISPAARLVSIGPATSRTLREHGLEPHIEAASHDLDGVVDALLADAAQREEQASRL
jgi:uroporphyrinogen III methyltransferase/synthase